MNNMRTAASWIAFAGAMIGKAAFGVTVLDTTSFWDGIEQHEWFGPGETSIYGQTFTVPFTDTILEQFVFYLDDGLHPVEFQAFVMR